MLVILSLIQNNMVQRAKGQSLAVIPQIGVNSPARYLFWLQTLKAPFCLLAQEQAQYDTARSIRSVAVQYVAGLIIQLVTEGRESG